MIIDVGGFLSIGKKTVASPMQDVQLRAYGGTKLRAHIPYTEDQFDSMVTWESESDL